jgi:hypothetical protein
MSILAASLQANLYFAIFLAIAAFGLVFGYFTVRGSGINNHPWDDPRDAPGARLPDEFHQFEERQIHAADVRRAAHAPDEMTIDEMNRRLAAEAAARRKARAAQTPQP